MNKASENFPPKVKGKYPWQSIIKLSKNVIPFITAHQAKFGDIYMVDAPINFVVLSHPDHIRHVVQANWKNYKKGFGYRNFSLMLGQGIISSEGEYWKRHRKMIQPMFYKEQINSIVQLMIDTSNEVAGKWKKIRAEGGAIEGKSEMIALSSLVIGRSLLGKDADRYLEELQKDIDVEYAFVMKRNRTMFPLPLWVPTLKNIKFKSARKRIDDIVYQMIQKRKGLIAGEDVLAMLQNAKDEDGIGMTDSEVRDEVLTMFIAGYETTAFSLSWTLYLLSKHQEVQKKLKEELTTVLKDGPITLEKMKGLVFLKAVIQESLRLYPSIWTFGRQSIEEDEIAGYKIPKNTHMFLSIYLAHRHKDFYESPEEFMPERFLNGKTKQEAFLPFGAGPRLCVGNHFAALEMEIALATLLREFSLKLKTDREMEIDPQVTLKPKGDLEICLG